MVDGGVLDNRPFGPVLDAIFHRMPSDGGQAIHRTLYYVEPDPERLSQQTKYTPIGVIANCALTLPQYDSIASDVQRVLHHNEQLKKLARLRRRVGAVATKAGAGVNNPLYLAALEQSIAGLLLGIDASEACASAQLESVADFVATQGFSPVALQSLDLGYQLRRAFSALYACNACLDDGSLTRMDRERIASIRYGLGRIIKAFKLLRDVWMGQVGELPSDVAMLDQELGRRLARLIGYLDGEWLSDPDREGIQGLTSELLTQESLSKWRDKALEWLSSSVITHSTKLEFDALGVVAALGQATVRLLAEIGEAACYNDFSATDSCVFPLELAAGIYERDLVEVARISPQDPKLPALPRDFQKVTGKRLGHFAGFLRRDWRTNDLAWGHVDALCQIICVLLDEEAFRLLSSRIRALTDDERRQLEKSFSMEELTNALGRAAAGPRATPIADDLSIAIRALSGVFGDLLANPEDRSTQEKFRDATVIVAQCAAIHEYLDLIKSDTSEQNKVFKWPTGPERTISGSSAIEQLTSIGLGERKMSDELPSSLIAEYLGRSVRLAWGMLTASTERSGVLASGVAVVGRYVRIMTGAATVIGQKLRAESTLGVVMIVSLLVGTGTYAVAAFNLGGYFAGVVSVLAFVVTAKFAAWPLLRPRQKVVWLVTLAILAVAILVNWFVYDYVSPCGRWIGDNLILLGERIR